MSKHTKKLLTAALGAACLFLPPGPGTATAQTNAAEKAAPKLEDLFGGNVIARGKGVEIKRGQLDSEVISRKTTLAMRGQSLSPEQTGLLERQVLEDIIGRQLLLAKATEADRTKGKQQFDESLQKWKAELKVTDEEFNSRLMRQLIMQDLSREQWEQQSIQRATASVVLDRELKVNITDADAKKYYDDNPTRFEHPEAVRLNHILFSIRDPRTNALLPDDQQKAKRKLAEEALKRAKSGEDFVKLVKEYSDDNLSKDRGGEVTVARQQTGLPEFEAAAFALQTNQISEVIATAIGYDIIRLEEKIAPKKEAFTGLDTKTIYRNQDGGIITIRDMLTNDGMQKLVPPYLTKLQKDAGVEILDEKLRAIELPKPAMPAGNGTNSTEKATQKTENAVEKK